MAEQRNPEPGGPERERGGDPACWLAAVCPECGRFVEAEVPTSCPRCGASIDPD